MYVIGADVGGTTVKLGVVQDGKNIVHREERPSPHHPVQMADLLCEMIRRARQRFPKAMAGISMPGTIRRGGLTDASQLGFFGVPFSALMADRLGEQLPIQNDGVCAMMAEYTAGALKGMDPCIMLTLGTGIGGGVMLHGAPCRGLDGVQAELGHMITHADGEACCCGQRGCWECYASASSLSRRAGGLDPREIVERVKRGELLALWQDYLYELAQGVIGLCSIFHPQGIAIGGGLSGAGTVLTDGLQAVLMQDPGYRQYYPDVTIRTAHFGNDAGIIGAAALTAME